MLITKITSGSVIQTFDTDTMQFITQFFEAGDEYEYSNSVTGEQVDSRVLEDKDGMELYLPYDMVQP